MVWWTIIAAYLLGSIPTGVMVARLYGVDLRKSGSGNIGATNALRVIGKKAGAVTLAGDVLKGAIAVLVALKFGGRDTALVAAAAAIIGHDFSIFMKLKGGKGVATSLGVMLPIDPVLVLWAIAIWLASVAIWRYSSLGALASFAAMPPIVAFTRRGDIGLWGLALFITVLAVYKHRSNIGRLIKGEEPKIGARPA